MHTNELRFRPMGLTAEEILIHVRALPPRERLKLVERVVHEVAEMHDDEAAIDAELAQRIIQAKQGHTVPAEDVIAELRERR